MTLEAAPAENPRPFTRLHAGMTFLTGGYMKKAFLAVWMDDGASDLPEYALAAMVLTAIAVVMKSLNIEGKDLLADIGIKTSGVPR